MNMIEMINKKIFWIFFKYIRTEYYFKYKRNIVFNKKCYVDKGSLLSLYGGGKIILGNNSTISKKCKIATCGGEIEIGNYSIIGDNATFLANGGITIGNNVMFADGVKLIANNHKYENIYLPISQQGSTSKGINIQDGVWIGMNVIVLDGVTIGENSIIGAGSIVTKNIPKYSVAVGNPARVIKYYDINTKVWKNR